MALMWYRVYIVKCFILIALYNLRKAEMHVHVCFHCLACSSLFADVINCMQTDNLELKKLVYLYLMNYAKSQPDLAILAVNTFSKDCEDSNPLIRALAVRTMGCIRVDKITEYLCEPLRKCLRVREPVSESHCGT